MGFRLLLFCQKPTIICSGKGSQSRTKPLDAPTFIRLFPIYETIVKPGGPALPELYADGRQHITTPMRRHRNFLSLKFCLKLLEAQFKCGSAFNCLTLLRDPGAQTTASRPGFEVSFRFVTRNFLDFAGDTHLPLLIGPVENERSVWIGRKFASLAALVVGEKDEASFVHAFEQNNPCRGHSILANGSEGCCVYFGVPAPTWGEEDFVGLYKKRANTTTPTPAVGLIKPHFELRNRVGFEIVPIQPGQAIFAAEIRNAHKLASCWHTRLSRATPDLISAKPLPIDGPGWLHLKCS